MPRPRHTSRGSRAQAPPRRPERRSRTTLQRLTRPGAQRGLTQPSRPRRHQRRTVSSAEPTCRGCLRPALLRGAPSRTGSLISVSARSGRPLSRLGTVIAPPCPKQPAPEPVDVRAGTGLPAPRPRCSSTSMVPGFCVVTKSPTLGLEIARFVKMIGTPPGYTRRAC